MSETKITLGKYKSFTTKYLVAFILVFAAIGVYLIINSFASTPVIASTQAENMIVPQYSYIVNDSSASGGKAVKMTRLASLKGTIVLPSTATGLSVSVKSVACNGNSPTFYLDIDGKSAISNTVVNSSSYRTYTISNLNLIKGSHAISISAFNLGYGSNCPRPLYVDVVNFYGPNQPPPPPPAPTVTISATPPAVTTGQSSTLTWSSTNASACTASGSWGGSEPTIGSHDTGALNATSTYILTCTGTGGTANGSATVTVGSGGTGAGPVSGASTAACNPSPCTPGIVPTTTANVVNLGTISNGSVGQTRTYGYYIPQNLLHDGSASGKPAVVFDMSRTNCGTAAANGEYLNSKMGPVADANRFIIVELECTTGTTNWIHPETDCGGAGGVSGGGTCDSSTAPSDEPYIKAAVADATTRFNLDPARRYLVGGSSAANMARDAICSSSQTPHNSTLFRGIMTMGGGANAKYNTTSGVCPSGDKTTFWLELMGKTSQADPYTTINIPASCTTNCDHSILGFDATRNWWAGYLGNCNAPIHSTTGSGVLSDVYDYACSDGNSTSPFFEAVAVTNGGHMWCGLDSSPAPNCGVAPNNTGGWSTAAYMWKFFAGTTTT